LNITLPRWRISSFQQFSKEIAIEFDFVRQDGTNYEPARIDLAQGSCGDIWYNSTLKKVLYLFLPIRDSP